MPDLKKQRFEEWADEVLANSPEIQKIREEIAAETRRIKQEYREGTPEELARVQAILQEAADKEGPVRLGPSSPTMYYTLKAFKKYVLESGREITPILADLFSRIKDSDEEINSDDLNDKSTE